MKARRKEKTRNPLFVVRWKSAVIYSCVGLLYAYKSLSSFRGETRPYFLFIVLFGKKTHNRQYEFMEVS